jgi:hypothetical protein
MYSAQKMAKAPMMTPESPLSDKNREDLFIIERISWMACN